MVEERETEIVAFPGEIGTDIPGQTSSSESCHPKATLCQSRSGCYGLEAGPLCMPTDVLEVSFSQILTP
jgi:hypothetical protein